MAHKEERALVLKHLCRYEQMLAVGGPVLEKASYFSSTPAYNCVFTCLCEIYDDSGGVPDKDVLMLYIVDRASGFGIGAGGIHMLRAEVSAWYSATDFSSTFVQGIIEQVYHTEAFRELMVQVSPNDEVVDVQGHVEKAHGIMKQKLFSALAEEFPFTDYGNMYAGASVPTGIPFLDEITDGGLTGEEAMGIIVPSGCGKTTLMTQLAGGQVVASRHVAYFSSEQSMRGDITQRLYSLATGRPKDVFKVEPHLLPQDVRDLLDRAGPQWTQYFHFHDSRSVQTMDEIFQVLDTHTSQGKKPDYALIDWWGNLRLSLAKHMPEVRDAQRRREIATGWMDKLVQGCKNRGIRLVVVHQMAGADAKKGPNATITSFSAQEDTSFPNYFSFTLVMNRPDSEGNARLTSDKVRSGANSRITVHLEGAYNRFIKAGLDNNRSMPSPVSMPLPTGANILTDYSADME